MSELLPSVQAPRIRESIVDYLGTTFALADDDARAALIDFLSDRDDGIFKGPFLRVRLPFRAADAGWRASLDDWYQGFPPYGHQAAAFARLTSINLGPEKPRPLPTLVTTGTGSGKTEAFLVPIVDHVLRARRRGIKGTKALILYPMNALANDQAQRLAAMLSAQDELAGITAALYTGQQGNRKSVSKDGLITDRGVIRGTPPDILLTNYKMLDQLLLRAEDASIWQQSATSLQYLVLDEFHSYDGAQGTDVSMLLRRLGLTLKASWPQDAFTPEDRKRPLGIVTPVATSATLGAKGDPAAMRAFAQTVFGEEFADDAVITESRMSIEEWLQGKTDAVARTDRAAIESAVSRAADLVGGRVIAETVLSCLFDDTRVDVVRASPEELLDLARAHPFTRALAERADSARPLGELVSEILPAFAADDRSRKTAEAFLLVFAAALSHVRKAAGRGALSVDLHLWVRELTRIDRVASGAPRYLWSDDGHVTGVVEDVGSLDAPAFPALFCRHCGRSGWAVLRAPVGGFDLQAADPSDIRRARFGNDREFRALIHAPSEVEESTSEITSADPDQPRLLWWHTTERRILHDVPEDDADHAAGRVLPILTHNGPAAGDFATDDTCPSCMQKDGIRFLGSAIATLLSVSLSTIFGSDDLDKNEKKALVFTDSVQDAAHRAGFVQSRSHSLTLRAVLQEAVPDGPVALDQLADRVLELAGDDRHRRYRILPADVADRPEFEEFWQTRKASAIPTAVRRRVKRRLLLDTVLEFGLQSRLGRTLELTGSVAAEVDIPRAVMLKVASEVEQAAGVQKLEGLGLDDRRRIAWVRGVLERMRTDGAIEHEWFRRYQTEDGRRYSIWGGRPRWDGMPAFPRGRGAPGYPRLGGATTQRHSDLVNVASPLSWYATWTRRALGCATAAEAAALAVGLIKELAERSVLNVVNTDSGGQVFEVPASRILVERIEDAACRGGDCQLTCAVCNSVVPGTGRVVDELEDAPCLVSRCAGHLVRQQGHPDNFYRRLYRATDITRVVAREHTSLLEDAERLAYERQFRASAEDPQAPNVLVATPTLEMGIDIGDLSTVILSSLPKSVASYLQRVGRAGRLTGSALNLAFVSGRGEQLPRLGDPLSVINGEVRPPATYLDAQEILRRQYLASVADGIARSKDGPHPTSATLAIGTVGEGSFLRTLIERSENPSNVEAFLAPFATLTDDTRQDLRSWSTPTGGALTSPLSATLHDSRHRWATEVEGLKHRLVAVQDSLPDLQERANLPAATEDDKVALRTATSAIKLINGQLKDLQGEYWISVLEGQGILPNYTLFDDSVTLDVTLSWIDPDTQEYMSQPSTFNRGAGAALREFAPGATFYARGHKIEIDAVDLGTEADAVRPWAFCPSCGFAEQRDAPPESCPRCEATAIADAGQVLEVVELQRVSSAMRREEASIDDGRDERERATFQIAIAADVDQPRKQWFVDRFPLGVKHLTGMTIRWLNLGRGGDPGTPQRVAGAEYTAPGFRVCAGCGKLDRQTGQNSPAEHRPWCMYRNVADENVRKVVLTRTLQTDGVVVQLPPDLPVGDPFAIPSLVAALQAGLRELVGGSPDHLAFERLPGDGVKSTEAILIHDVVPGGTGYLAELAEPERFYALLHRAWTLVRDCPCKDEGRSSCHRCLSPFIHGSSQKFVSRMAAERHLRTLLLGGLPADEPKDAMAWVVTEEAWKYDPETGIEQQFRQLLRPRLEEAIGAIQAVDSPDGVRWLFTAPGGRTWSMEPQLALGGVRPDFVFRSNDQALPGLAVFCDGWRFHASPAINRIADDARKREQLRQQGYAVVSVTWADLQDAMNGTMAPPEWFDAARWRLAMQQSHGTLKPGMQDVVVGGPIDYIVRWISKPDPDAFRAMADAVPLLLVGAGTTGKAAADEPLVRVAETIHGGGTLPTDGSRPVWAWKHDTLSVVAGRAGDTGTAADMIAVLDDREDWLGHDHKSAWREWLRMSTLLNLRLLPTRLTSVSLLEEAQEATTEEGVELPEPWSSTYRAAVGATEKDLIAKLASSGLPLPELGYETADGLPLAVSWPDRHVVVELDLTRDDREELIAHGWTVVATDLTQIQHALA